MSNAYALKIDGAREATPTLCVNGGTGSVRDCALGVKDEGSKTRT